MFKSRMWGIGWNPSAALPKETRHALSRVRTTSRALSEKICEAGLLSVPGRTARLKTIYLLQIAAEIEHALMVQYLYAAYAIDEMFDDGRDDRLLANITRWKRDIRTIARQEMAHLITVQNLLLTLGADVYLNRENNFSLHPDEYPFPVCFEPLSLKSLAKYVVTESPDPTEIPSRHEKTMLAHASNLVNADLKMKVNRVGVVYLTLYWLFLPSDTSRGPWRHAPSLAPGMKRAGLLGVHLQNQDFLSPRVFQDFAATPDEWGVFETQMKVSKTDPRSNALAAIHWIMAQGEGPVGLESANQSTEDASHFQKFLRIFEEFRDARSDYRGAVRDVPVNPVVTDQRVRPEHRFRSLITEPQARMWARLFDLRYQMLILDILLALSTNRRLDGKLRKTLIHWAVFGEMEFLRIIGQILPMLPRHPGSLAKAGPPFETIDVPADTAKRWDLERVLIKASDHLVGQLRKIAGRARRDVLHKIQTFDRARLALVNEKSTVPRRFHWRAGKVSRISRQGGQ